MPWLALGMGATGAARGWQQNDEARRNNILQAHLAQYSPWTSKALQPGALDRKNYAYEGLQKGLTGGFQQQQDSDMADAYKKYLASLQGGGGGASQAGTSAGAADFGSVLA